jgi:hypothetical protein
MPSILFIGVSAGTIWCTPGLQGTAVETPMHILPPAPGLKLAGSLTGACPPTAACSAPEYGELSRLMRDAGRTADAGTPEQKLLPNGCPERLGPECHSFID